MIKLLGIDFETQCADAPTTRMTEAGAVLVEVEQKADWRENVWTVKEKLEMFCWEPDYPPQTPEIIELTGIDDEMLRAAGKPRREVVHYIAGLMAKADIIVAHKKSFDQTVLESTAKLFNIELPKRHWLCTLTEFPWRKGLTCHKLSHLAFEHDIKFDRQSLHRAVNDVDLMFATMSQYDLQAVLNYWQTPWMYLKAECAGPWVDKGVQNAIAKSCGFSYESVKGTDFPKWPKTWVTRVKGHEAAQAVKNKVRDSASPFRVSNIEGIS